LIMASIGSSKATGSFVTSEADVSDLDSPDFDQQTLHGFHIDFDHGPDIELRPLQTPDTTTVSTATADKVSGALDAIEHRGRWGRRLEEWGWETAACLLSIVGFLGTTGLLKAFDGKAQPSWPYGITLNSAVAVLSTITKDLLIVPAAACISQSIWISYAESAHPLRLLTTYDAASRGPLGALHLIWRLRAW
jgi:hypothetical protein